MPDIDHTPPFKALRRYQRLSCRHHCGSLVSVLHLDSHLQLFIDSPLLVNNPNTNKLLLSPQPFDNSRRRQASALLRLCGGSGCWVGGSERQVLTPRSRWLSNHPLASVGVLLGLWRRGIRIGMRMMRSSAQTTTAGHDQRESEDG